MHTSPLPFSSPSPFARPIPLIFGVQGDTLTPKEAIFFRYANPLGFILFKWNLKNPSQIRSLIHSLKEAVGRPNISLMIDAEGGRVFRLPREFFDLPPAPRVLGDLYDHDRARALQECYETYYKIGQTLKELGFTLSCSPLLDLDVPGTHGIIGDRSFGADPQKVGALGQRVVQGLHAAGITPVIKHIPGHGEATGDSHEELPVIALCPEELAPHWIPFQMNAQVPALEAPATSHPAPHDPKHAPVPHTIRPWAMTAHVLYPALDPQRPATVSPTLISTLIREVLNFQGVLVSDDLHMKALSGTPAEKIRQALVAGCDVALYGMGRLEEFQQAVTDLTPFLLDHTPRPGVCDLLSQSTI